jgi:hypothetical protein
MNYGSLNNLMAADARYPDPEVGMGMTFISWTDRKAGTIVEVVNAKTIRVQADTSTRTDGLGMTDAQTYDYSPDPDAPIETYTLRSNGRWVRKGESAKGGSRIAIGARSTYHDFSF